MDRVRPAAAAPALALLATACAAMPEQARGPSPAAHLTMSTAAAAPSRLPRPAQTAPPPADRPVSLRCEAARSGGVGLHIALAFIRRRASVTPYGFGDGGDSAWDLFWSDQLYLLDREGAGGTHRLAIDRVTGNGALIAPAATDDPVVSVACYRVTPRL